MKWRVTLRLLAFVLIGTVLSAKAHASPIVIGLEGFTDGEALTNQVPGLLFTNASIATAGITLNEFDFPPASGVNVAFDSGGPVRIDFLSTLASFAAHFTYSVPIVLEAFDAADNSLGTIASAFAENYVSSGNSPNEFLEAAFLDMAYVTITGDALGGSFTMDDLVLTPVAAPEPGTLLLLSLAVSGAYVRAKRRRTRTPRG